MIRYVFTKMVYNYLKIRGKMQYYTFLQLFGFRNPYMLFTKVDVRIGKITLHAGAEVNKGVTIDGVDLFSLQGKILQVRLVGNTYWIMGVQNG